MRELRRRDVIRTNNNPVGDIAEAIVHAHYGGTRAGFSQAGWDVTTDDGERIQVKAMRLTPTTKRRNVSPIRDRDYDSVVIVVFDEDFQVTEASSSHAMWSRSSSRIARTSMAASSPSRRCCGRILASKPSTSRPRRSDCTVETCRKGDRSCPRS